MSNLIGIQDLLNGKVDPVFYLPGRWRLPGDNKLSFIERNDLFQEINKEYPHKVLMHNKEIAVDEGDILKRFWIDFRRTVERQCTGDIIYWYKNMDYKWCWNIDKAQNEYERKYTTVRVTDIGILHLRNQKTKHSLR